MAISKDSADILKTIDIHCHLQHEQFDPDRESVIREAKEKMEFLIVSGARPDWNREAISLAKLHQGFIFATIGMHPMDAQKMTEKEFNDEIDFTVANRENIAGIGEVGLDFHWEKDESKRALQRERFIKYIELAKEINKPLVVHSWNAESEVLKVLQSCDAKSVVLHCFSGNKIVLSGALSSGYYISYSPIIAFSKLHKKLARDTPLDRIMIETDAPYLDPNHGRNVPWNTIIAAEKIASAKNIDVRDVVSAAISNARKVFGI